MDTTTIIIIVAVVALLALFLYNRSRPAPRGTYDDKNSRSSGSIGGGTRAHDDENVRSSGSIGGGTRAYDTPSTSSGGSIGGGPSTPSTRAHHVEANDRLSTLAEEPEIHTNERRSGDKVNERLVREHSENTRSETTHSENNTEGENARKNDDPRYKSNGSFGQ